MNPILPHLMNPVHPYLMNPILPHRMNPSVSLGPSTAFLISISLRRRLSCQSKQML
jgi:hypothetical protein